MSRLRDDIHRFWQIWYPWIWKGWRLVKFIDLSKALISGFGGHGRRYLGMTRKDYRASLVIRFLIFGCFCSVSFLSWSRGLLYTSGNGATVFRCWPTIIIGWDRNCFVIVTCEIAMFGFLTSGTTVIFYIQRSRGGLRIRLSSSVSCSSKGVQTSRSISIVHLALSNLATISDTGSQFSVKSRCQGLSRLDKLKHTV